MTTGTAKAPATTHRSVTRTDPLRLFRTSLFDEPFTLFRPFAPFAEETLPLSSWAPACDIFETDKQIVVRAELPGMRREDIHVSVEHNTLLLSGERRFEHDTTREHYHRVERNYGEFTRSFSLPHTVAPDRIQATFSDGLLTVTLPKREEALPKQIEVKIN